MKKTKRGKRWIPVFKPSYIRVIKRSYAADENLQVETVIHDGQNITVFVR